MSYLLKVVSVVFLTFALIVAVVVGICFMVSSKQCDMYNARYKTNFTHEEFFWGIQSIQVRIEEVK